LNTKSVISCLTVVMLLMLIAFPIVSAIDDPYIIEGHITDNGIPITNIVITVTNMNTSDSFSTTTNSIGYYEMVVARNTLNDGTVVYPNGVSNGDTIRISFFHNSTNYFSDVIVDSGQAGKTVDIEIRNAEIEPAPISSGISLLVVSIVVVILIAFFLLLVWKHLHGEDDINGDKA